MTAIVPRSIQRDLSPIYAKYEPMIHSRAIHYATSFNHDKNDLVSIGNYVFMRAWQKWQSSKGVKFGTYLYRCLCNAMNDFCRQVDLPPAQDMLDAVAEPVTVVDPYHQARLRDSMRNLSLSARSIAQLVLTRPAHTLCLEGDESAYQIRMKLRAKLSKQGWTERRIRAAFNELVELTREMYE